MSEDTKSFHLQLVELLRDAPRAATVRVIESIANRKGLKLQTRVDRTERHPAFQLLARPSQNKIHSGNDAEKERAMTWFVHQLIVGQMAVDEIDTAVLEGKLGSDRLKEGISVLRNHKLPKHQPAQQKVPKHQLVAAA